MSIEQNAYNNYGNQITTGSKARRERNKEVLSVVKEVCKKHGGSADIGDGFIVVNTKHFEVRAK